MRTGNRAVAFGLLAAGLLAAAAPAEGGGNRIAGIRFWSLGDLTRVAIETQTDAVFRADRAENPPRIFFDLEGVGRQPGKRGIEAIEVGDALLKRIRIAETQPGTTRVVLDLEVRAEYSVSQLANPARIVIELRLAGGATPRPPVRSTSGRQDLTGGSATAKPEPALDLPSVQRTAPPQAAKPRATSPAKPEPPLDLPSVQRTAPPQAAKPRATSPAKPEPPLDLSSAQRTPKPAKPEPALTAQPQTAKPEAALELPLALRTGPPEPAKPARDAQAAKGAAVTPLPDASRARPQAAATEPIRTSLQAGTEAAARASQPAGTTQVGQAPGLQPGSQPGPAAGLEPAPPKAAPALAAKSDSRGDRSLIRALGLKLERIVLDPGHGGHDTGTIGPGGYQEKDLVLDIAQRLGKLIGQRLGSEVIYTRADDTFVALEERTAMANDRKADLFLSIHANSSRSRSIAGSETFYLNFTTTADELEVAARENATSQTSIHELQDLLQSIMKSEKSQESREFAGSVQKALHSGLSRGRWKNRGVKKAPFVVLIKASMPSVLAEVAFLSNPREETQLKRPDYRQRVAEALYRGVSQYANTLSHFRTAQDRPPAR